MRLTQLVGRTIRETPREAELPSHRLLLRAGYMRQYTSGVYGLLPLATRSIQKIEKIIREEMNAVSGQEIRMSCLATKELWSESGRYQAIGNDMFRLQDRNKKDLVLNMTHEEPVVALARTELTSYKQLPAMMYQIQTKFRDEPRPRGGLIRLREFTMKDAYSFHSSEDDLQDYYWKVHAAYVRVFKRAGLDKVVSVQSDNGMFGGRFSHEFQLLVPTGEDTLITCTQCDYKANKEIATTPFAAQTQTASQPLTKVSTPGQKTISEVCAFLKISPEQTAKAVLFQTPKEELIAVFIRGDLDVIEQKLRTVVGSEITPASEALIRKSGGEPGSCGPIGLTIDKNLRIVFDASLNVASGYVTGANTPDVHYTGFEIKRDLMSTLTPEQKSRVLLGDVAQARPGDPCPECKAPLQETRGIEIGNIFHLGTKYSSSMGATYLDVQGKTQPYIMGCYGIGVTRLLPSAIEEHHDDAGIKLPLPIAPFQVHLCVLNRKEETVREASEKLYTSLMKAGIEVLIDDRDEKAGSQFADADLIGIPLRLILSPKTLAENSVEFKFRDGRAPVEKIKLDSLLEFLRSTIQTEMARYDAPAF